MLLCVHPSMQVPKDHVQDLLRARNGAGLDALTLPDAQGRTLSKLYPASHPLHAIAA